MAAMETSRDQLDQRIKAVFSGAEKTEGRSEQCPPEEKLAAYAEGRLSRIARNRVSRHIASCSDCLDCVLSLTNLLESQDAASHSPVPAALVDRAKGLMDVENSTSLWSRLRWPLAVQLPKPAWALASVLLVVVAFSAYRGYFSHETATLVPAAGSGIKVLARVPSGIVTRGSETIYRAVEIENGDVLRSRDSFRITFPLAEDRFVYLILVGSSGRATLLYSADAVDSSARGPTDAPIVLPGADRWYELDRNIGDEMLFLLTSATPLEDIEQKLLRMKALSADPIAGVFPGTQIESFTIRHR